MTLTLTRPDRPRRRYPWETFIDRIRWWQPHRILYALAVLVRCSSLAMADPGPPAATLACGPAFGPNGSLLPGHALLVLFSTQGSSTGHVGSSDVCVDVGRVAVADGGIALGQSGSSIKVYLPHPPDSPAPCVKAITMNLNPKGFPVAASATCADGVVKLTLDGGAVENVRAVDNRNIPRNVGIGGTAHIEIEDAGVNDRVRVWFTPDATDPGLWAATPGFIFDVAITEGSITSDGVTPTLQQTWGTVKIQYR